MKKLRSYIVATTALLLFLSGCSGDSGNIGGSTYEEHEYGIAGQYMDEVKIEGNDDYIVYYPENHITGAPLILFAGYFKAVGNGNGHLRNEGVMRYLASLGCCVVGNKKQPGDWEKAEDFLAVFSTDFPIPDGVDKDKFAIVGHSAGGMASYCMMRHFKDKGYGATKSFIIDLHGYYASSMTRDDLGSLTEVDSLMIAYGGYDGNTSQTTHAYTPDFTQNPRVLLTLSHLLPDSINKGFIVLQTKDHMYNWGEYEAIGDYEALKNKKDLLTPIDAMVKYEFFNDNGEYDNVKELLFGDYNNTIKKVDEATTKYENNGGHYAYDCSIENSIDYCNEYKNPK